MTKPRKFPGREKTRTQPLTKLTQRVANDGGVEGREGCLSVLAHTEGGKWWGLFLNVLANDEGYFSAFWQTMRVISQRFGKWWGLFLNVLVNDEDYFSTFWQMMGVIFQHFGSYRMIHNHFPICYDYKTRRLTNFFFISSKSVRIVIFWQFWCNCVMG